MGDELKKVTIIMPPEQPTKKGRKKRAHTVADRLRTLELDVRARANYNMPREGLFRGVMKATFVKAYECARYCNGIDEGKADEGSYFVASALRGTCEELIALKFIRQLSRRERDEVILIEMTSAVKKAIAEQQKFFKQVRPFQPVIPGGIDDAIVAANRARLNVIGRSSGLWRTDGKLPPIEQMAIKLNMRAIYDYFYRITSDVVHFNPRIALRNGWGPNPRQSTFSTKNFGGYYLAFTQVYSVFLFIQLCRSFRRDLSLGPKFMAQVRALDDQLAEIGRWPEAVTYQEMNIEDPGPILRIVLKAIHEIKKKERIARRKSMARNRARTVKQT